MIHASATGFQTNALFGCSSKTHLDFPFHHGFDEEKVGMCGKGKELYTLLSSTCEPLF